MEIWKLLSPRKRDLAKLDSNFGNYLSTKYPDLPDESEDKKFLFSALDKQKFVGGISGNVYWNGLEIDMLWVDDDFRDQGIGRILIMEAEKYAINNGAVVSFLKTVDAKVYYEKFGYHVYGILEDRPIGTVLYHMKKRLDEKNSL
ncbi:MAG: GNAT family N-acetyltransferase [Maribacter sp.]|nr:GNAT family N-acetyltransferase [Maribacter sp.]